MLTASSGIRRQGNALSRQPSHRSQQQLSVNMLITKCQLRLTVYSCCRSIRHDKTSARVYSSLCTFVQICSTISPLCRKVLKRFNKQLDAESKTVYINLRFPVRSYANCIYCYKIVSGLTKYIEVRYIGIAIF